MPARVLVAAFVFLGFFLATAPAQQPERAADLERRLGELEKQLGLLLKEVQGLRKELQATESPAALRMEVKIFTLKKADPVDMTRILQDLFQGKDGRTIRITADPRTNSLIVHSRTDQLQLIEAVIARLDEGPAPRKSAEPGKKTSRQRRADLERRLAQAESELALSKDRAAWSARMAKLGYLSESQVQAERARLEKAQIDLELAKADLKELPAEPEKPAKEEGPKK